MPPSWDSPKNFSLFSKPLKLLWILIDQTLLELLLPLTVIYCLHDSSTQGFPWEKGLDLIYSLLILQTLDHCLTHNRSLANISKVTKWIKSIPCSFLPSLLWSPRSISSCKSPYSSQQSLWPHPYAQNPQVTAWTMSLLDLTTTHLSYWPPIVLKSAPSVSEFLVSFLCWFSCCCCLFITKSCPTLCDPTDCSMPGFPVHHQYLELSQTHVHRVGDGIQQSHPFSSCFQSFPASGSFLMSLFLASGGQSIGVSALASVLPMNIQGDFI